MNLTTKDLQTILYSLEGYMQGNDDNELVEELDDICYRINKKLDEKYKELDETISNISDNIEDTDLELNDYEIYKVFQQMNRFKEGN